MLWENLREEEFLGALEQANGVCALPIGCVEAHGQHLPLGCDVMHARELTIRAAEKEPVVVFPTMYFGEKSGAGEFHGTIIFPEKLIIDILEQCCEEIGRNGFRKIIIVNGHGGNTSVVQTFVRSVLQKKRNYTVYSCNELLPFPKVILSELGKYPYLTEEDIEVLRAYGGKAGGHGCFTETGWLYDIVPELVRLDKMDKVDGRSNKMFDEFTRKGIYTPFSWMGNYPNSYSADMHYGMNARIAKAMAQSTTDKLADIFKFLKEETISTEYHKQWIKKNYGE